MITEKLYSEMQKYVGYFINKKIGYSIKIDILDIVHNVITDENFDTINWLVLVQRHIYSRLAELKIKTIEFSDYCNNLVYIEEKWICQCCHEELYQSYFSSNSSYCKRCFYIVNKSKIKQIQKKYRENHKNEECYKLKVKNRKKRMLEKNPDYYKQYHAKNKEKINNRKKAYRQKNKEAVAEYNKNYKQQNKEAIAEYNKTYYQKKKNENNNCQSSFLN